MTIYTLEDGILFKLKIIKTPISFRNEEAGWKWDISMCYISSDEPNFVGEIFFETEKQGFLINASKKISIKKIMRDIMKAKEKIKNKIANRNIQKEQEEERVNDFVGQYNEKCKDYIIGSETYHNKIEQWRSLSRAIENDKDF